MKKFKSNSPNPIYFSIETLFKVTNLKFDEDIKMISENTEIEIKKKNARKRDQNYLQKSAGKYMIETNRQRTYNLTL